MEKLEVLDIGSYKVSLANNIADLRRIDESVFKVAPSIDAILAEHYETGFGFMICLFQTNLKAHPIGFIGSRMSDGTLYFPTRHEHGDEHHLAHFDHTLYAINVDKSFGRAQPKHPKSSPLKGIHWERLVPGGIGEVDGDVCNIYQRRMIGQLENNDQYAVFNVATAEAQAPPPVAVPIHPELLRYNQLIQEKSAARAPNAEVTSLWLHLSVVTFLLLLDRCSYEGARCIKS